MPRTEPIPAAVPADAFVAVAAATCHSCEAVITPGVNRVVVRNSRVYHAEHAPVAPAVK